MKNGTLNLKETYSFPLMLEMKSQLEITVEEMATTEDKALLCVAPNHYFTIEFTVSSEWEEVEDAFNPQTGEIYYKTMERLVVDVDCSTYQRQWSGMPPCHRDIICDKSEEIILEYILNK